MTFQFHHTTIGGTFDHFHLGHKRFIDMAFARSQKVTIGITTAKLLQHKSNPHSMEDFETRKKSLINYLTEKKYVQRVVILPIDTIYGTTLEDKTINAIFVTESTYENANHINSQRKELHLPPMEIVLVPFTQGSDKKVISSERIRGGEIDRNGNSYVQLFMKEEKITLPQQLREKLRIPIGTSIQSPNELIPPYDTNSFLITVGDIVTITFVNKNYQPAISIIDFKTKRKSIDDPKLLAALPQPYVTVINPAGAIDQKAVLTFESAIKHFYKTKKTLTIGIDGEEDLLTLPAILLAPLGSTVIYGQSDIGMIAVPVTEKKKEEVKKLLQEF